jgi:predicted nucleic acid-binding protein
MKRLFIDTNVILDLFMNRVPFSFDAADLFELASQEKINLFVSPLSFNNIYYISRKSIGHDAAIANLKKMSALTIVLDVTKKIIDDALVSDNPDFEDAIQYYTALANNSIEAIVTRDRIGFKKSTLPVFSPAEILKLLA